MGHIYGQQRVEVAFFKKQNNTFFKIAHVFLSRVIKQRLSMFQRRSVNVWSFGRYDGIARGLRRGLQQQWPAHRRGLALRHGAETPFARWMNGWDGWMGWMDGLGGCLNPVSQWVNLEGNLVFDLYKLHWFRVGS